MKECSKCKQIKPLDRFNNHISTKDKKTAWCKDCIIERSKKYYNHNKEKVLYKRQEERQLLNIFLKENKNCLKCGEVNPIMLDFHHIDPTKKDFNISELIKRRKNISEIENEIEKCIILCSNHHREFHYLEYKNNITIEEYLS